VWAAGTRTLTTAIDNSATIAAAVWGSLTSGLTTAGSIGKLLADRIDAAITSRSTYDGSDTSGTTTLLGRLTSTRATGLDNLDATVSSRLAGSGYTTPLDAAGTRSALGLASASLDTQLDALPTAAEAATAVRSELATELAHLDADVSSRLAPDGTLATVTTLTNAPDVPTAEEISAEVWSTTVREVTGGTVDNLVNAPDVPTEAEIATAVRGELSTELARLDADVSSRLADADYEAPATAEAIATAVQAGILDEDDGQAILDAIVTAIGNSNVDEVALVAAIRADLERNGGTLATRLATADYSAPPTAAENANAVRDELEPELDRLVNTATTQEVADIVESAAALPEN
jgi:hypothetical protein